VKGAIAAVFHADFAFLVGSASKFIETLDIEDMTQSILAITLPNESPHGPIICSHAGNVLIF
jgi:hypothetical protein